MIKFSIPIFLHFRTQQVFLKYLAKFQSITNHRTHVFWPLFPRIYRRHFSLFQVWVENWRKWRHFLKNTTRVEIIMTISIEVRIRITKALAHKFVQFSTLIVIIIYTRTVFLRKDVIFSNSQPRLGTRKINGGRKFPERKVRKTWVLWFVTDWNLARCLGHTHCVRKCKKMDIENLIIVAL